MSLERAVRAKVRRIKPVMENKLKHRVELSSVKVILCFFKSN